MGNSSAPATPAQIDRCSTLIAKAMSEGAFGVGSGLFYAPQSYASTEEVIAVLKGATPYGGVYDTHQRDESSYTIGLLEFGARGDPHRPGDRAHHQHRPREGARRGRLGRGRQRAALMREERAAGTWWWPTSIPGPRAAPDSAPPCCRAGPRQAGEIRCCCASPIPATRDRILVEMRDNLRRRGGDSTLLLTGGRRGPALRRQDAEAGRRRERQPAVETALELIRPVGDIGVASFNMTEQDIETFMKDPFVMTSSDGSGGHPRLYGTYPRKIRRYVLDKPVITMERMVRASSGQVAEVYGIADRGELKEGNFADVIVFDPKTIRDEATYVEPEKLVDRDALGVRERAGGGRRRCPDRGPGGQGAEKSREAVGIGGWDWELEVGGSPNPHLPPPNPVHRRPY